ncbi:MAG: HD domain-containing protein [Bacteroidales bacterium]|nr:HD domain-containing protein [Bacteroidales bacterium]
METLIANTASFVKQSLNDAEAGHDWWHTQRVFNNACKILEHERANAPVVKLAALLHDIADAKFHYNNEDIGWQKANEYLQRQNIEKEIIVHVINIIKHVSFKGGNTQQSFTSAELCIVQDADRLDAMGAIGIARAFHYGGFKNRELYNPAIFPRINMTPAEYRNHVAPTINHFYEKLLLLKDKMNTKTGKRMAEERHQFMLSFLDAFFQEWG